LLADGARFVGICDEIGRGIDVVYRSVLTGGFEFPMFESGGGQFTATIPLNGSENFREFVRDRSQALTQLDEIVVLRLLWSREVASAQELCSAMQRGTEFGQQVLRNMCQKAMIKQDFGVASIYRLTDVLRKDIEYVFQRNQMSFDMDMFGGPQ
jgi:predicted HTH transcriptional regulator